MQNYYYHSEWWMGVGDMDEVGKIPKFYWILRCFVWWGYGKMTPWQCSQLSTQYTHSTQTSSSH